MNYYYSVNNTQLNEVSCGGNMKGNRHKVLTENRVLLTDNS